MGSGPIRLCLGNECHWWTIPTPPIWIGPSLEVREWRNSLRRMMWNWIGTLPLLRWRHRRSIPLRAGHKCSERTSIHPCIVRFWKIPGHIPTRDIFSFHTQRGSMVQSVEVGWLLGDVYQSMLMDWIKLFYLSIIKLSTVLFEADQKFILANTTTGTCSISNCCGWDSKKRRWKAKWIQQVKEV